ncbi:hypothetical protein ACFZDK_49065 [Streptomyces sp. NPDC007901]|uniref:hypothetical protein n=1 Tax=Streptomyces sp. NPDC007901 TaxID=3364785 RepID=UPI0036E333AF
MYGPGAAGEFVPDGFVALAGLGLLQRAELAQRLELIGAGSDPGGFAQFGFPGGGGRGFGGELVPDGRVDVRVVDRVRGRGGEQLVDALPLRELRPAAFVVGEVLVAGVLPNVEAGFLEGRRDGGRGHPPRPASYHPPADPRVVARFAGRSRAGNGTADSVPGRPGAAHQGLAFGVRSKERAAARALCDGPQNMFYSRP